jgi:hypothetical protein
MFFFDITTQKYNISILIYYRFYMSTDLENTKFKIKWGEVYVSWVVISSSQNEIWLWFIWDLENQKFDENWNIRVILSF